jgi:hypothetical protein
MRSPCLLRIGGLLLLALGCREELPEPPPEGLPNVSAEEIAAGPPTARWDVVDTLRAGRDLSYHAGDGGGRAWIESVEPVPLRAGTPGRIAVVYEAGPEGIPVGGYLFLQPSPFWRWSPPQVEDPEAGGYTTLEPQAEGVELLPRTLDRDGNLLGIEVAGRGLEPGDRVRMVYGAGPALAMVDQFADADARLWIAVDADGDGVRRTLPDSPRVEVKAGPPAQLLVTLPTLARPGEAVRVQIAVLDAAGSRGVEVEGEVVLESAAPGLELPERIRLAPEAEGVVLAEGVARQPGVVRLRARGPGGLEADSNPMLVSAEGPRVLWGDLHGHSSLSDGTGTPDAYLAYARDVAGLDVVALTDHDHWGILPLVDRPELWQEIRDATRRFHQPGRFVTLLGFEWTSWIHGHRHVLYFADDGPLIDSVDPATESPLDLWRALEGLPALTFAHHSAGGPVATNWEIAPDPRFEPVTEVVSIHGASEAPDAPVPIYDPVAGNFVRDVLDRGYVLGFVGSGDGHDGHPGLTRLAADSGGLAAILAEDRTREAVEAALRARRVYATNGPRILLRMALGPHRMGETVRVAPDAPLTEELFVSIVGTGPLARIDVIRSGELLLPSLDLDGRLDATLHREVEDLRPGEYLYVRILQQDGGAAWSSPIFIASAEGARSEP